MNEGADHRHRTRASRPNADDISPDEEMKRLSKGLDIIRKLYPTGKSLGRCISCRYSRSLYPGIRSTDDQRHIGENLILKIFRNYGRVESRLYFDAKKGRPKTMMQQIRYEHIIPEMGIISQNVSPDSSLGVNDISLSIP